jgi:hypothetical protein
LIDGHLSDGTILPLYRLRYNGSASIWGFAIYLASRDGHEDNILPSGLPAGSPEEALDCVCGLYLNDATGWSLPPTNQRRGPLGHPKSTAHGHHGGDGSNPGFRLIGESERQKHRLEGGGPACGS